MSYLVDECFRAEVERHKWACDVDGHWMRRYTARDEDGRVTGRKRQFLHNFVWLLAGHQVLPAGITLDHINRDPGDNRLENLRPATKRLQSLNRKLPRASGLPRGVYRDGVAFRKKPFQVQVYGRHFGRYATAEEASTAYEAELARHIEAEAQLTAQLVTERPISPYERGQHV